MTRVAVTLLTAVAVGCSPQTRFIASDVKMHDVLAQSSLRQVNFEETTEALSEPACESPAPFGLDGDTSSINYWDLTLDEAIQLSLSNSTVLRDLGALIVQAPGLTSTIYDPALQTTDPRFGTEAVLSAFDAEFSTRAFFEKNHRALNNALLGGGTNFFRQDLWRVQSELSKRAVTGAQFSLRHNIDDDLNNATQNIFGTSGLVDSPAWTWNTEAEIRQPLLQGSGVEFNRIAGPDGTPGLPNGIMIARVNTDISAADFQLALRDYLSNVENAYWELVFAYRDLDAKKKARDRSLEVWQAAKKRGEDVSEDKIAQAAEQYFRFQEEVEIALSGRLVDGTREFNGSTGGTFQGTGGVYVAERRLRLIIGVPINDRRLIRPVTEPVPAKVVVDWQQLSAEALTQRTEIIRQRLRVKRRDMELAANRNFLLPRLDAVGQYRRRGLGPNLYDPSVPDPMGGTPPPIVGSGSNEWQIGLELTLPIGYRLANSGVRNGELAVARERAVLVELERQIVHDLSNAVADQSRSFQQVQTAYNRRVAAEKQYEFLTSAAVQDIRRIDYNLMLDTVRRLADAEAAYNRAVVGYAVALKNLHVESGDLMHYCNIQVSGAG